MQDIAEIGQVALQHGPLVAVIVVLMRSNANKDRIIADLTSQALDMARTARAVIEKAAE